LDCENLTDILFDLESKIRQSLSGKPKLGVQETGKSISETQKQAKKPEPEKLEPPKQPTYPLQPPQKIYVEGSPKQRTNGMLQMICNE
jgi:hypothetical protein